MLFVRSRNDLRHSSSALRSFSQPHYIYVIGNGRNVEALEENFPCFDEPQPFVDFSVPIGKENRACAVV